MNAADLRIRVVPASEAPAICEPILRSVPQWFGIEAATRKYIEDAARLPTWVAFRDGEAAGFLTVARHYPGAAEIHCMAVRLGCHGQGIGTALVRTVQEALRADGVGYLQVKTQGPSRPSAEYARTIHFYESVGFVRLEEVRGLWPGLPTLILVKRI